MLFNIQLLLLLLCIIDYSSMLFARSRLDAEIENEQMLVDDEQAHFGDTVIENNLLVKNNILGHELFIDGDVVIDDDLTVGGDTFIGGTLEVVDTVSADCDLFVGCNLYIKETTDAAHGVISKYTGTTGNFTAATFLHNAGVDSLFLGNNSGNITGGVENVGIGTHALEIVDAGGDFNTAVGAYVLQVCTTGYGNTAVGDRALFSATTGTFNVALGKDTFANITTGSENIGVGYAAGNGITTGNNNIIIANNGTSLDNGVIRIGTSGVQNSNFQAGIYNVTAATVPTSVVSVDSNGQLGTGIITNNINVTGSSSTEGNLLKNDQLFLHNNGTDSLFVGLNAGNYTGGFNNVGVGAHVLESVQAGATNNTAVGKDSMSLCTLGFNNTALGTFTLEMCTSGSNNTVVGYNGLVMCDTGTYNVGVGSHVLPNLTTGTSNVAVGYAAGFSLTTGVNNINLGHMAGISLSPTAANNIMIGNVGTTGDNGVIRLGTSGTHTQNFQTGIYNVTATTVPTSVVSVDSNGQLGTGIITNNINVTGSSPVEGNVLKNGQLFLHNNGVDCLFVGLNSGNYTAGDSNVGVGPSTLTNVDITALDNTAVGSYALNQCTTGISNTAFGNNTLSLCTTGSDNTALGDASLFNLSTGSGNIAIGNSAGINILTTNDNILIGNVGQVTDSGIIRIGNSVMHGANYQAGIFGTLPSIASNSVVAVDGNNKLNTGIITNNINVTGSSLTGGSILKNGVLFIHNAGPDKNTFVGTDAGNTTLTGISNTGIGSDALQAVTSGINNTALGVSALKNLTGGIDNIAIGFASGLNCTSGIRNVGVGVRSLSDLTTGSFNIALGHNAGSAITTTSDNILIGNVGQVTDSGMIRIGNSVMHGANYQAGIFGTLPSIASNSVVAVDGNNKLNTGIITNNINITGSTLAGGNVLKNGRLFLHNLGTNNTFLGEEAGNIGVVGLQNTGVGTAAFLNIVNGSVNVGVGSFSMLNCTSGSNNVGVGDSSLFNLSTGSGNIAIGAGSGSAITTTNNNIYIGNSGTLGDVGVIHIGTSGVHASNYQEGIYGQGVLLGAVPVFIDTNHKLGTIPSSIRFKENVSPIAADTVQQFSQLDPVSFTFIGDNVHQKQYGFIAEEVATLLPELIAYDADGNVYTVKYYLMYALLHQWLKNLQITQDEQKAVIADQAEQLVNKNAEIMACQKDIADLKRELVDQRIAIDMLFVEVALLKNLLTQQA